MKRLLPAATVLVALLLPASASALSTGAYTGTNSQGFALASGKLSNVLNGESHGATCTSGDLTWSTHHV